MEFVRWFDKIRLHDTDLVGGKGANLGELTAAGLPVPPGFVVTSEAYHYAIDQAQVAPQLAAVLAGVNTNTTADLTRAADEAQRLVRGVALPGDLAAAILDAYHRLGEGVRVAIRSSGIGEDAGDSSFAGMNVTFTNVLGDDDVLASVVGCWASLYGARVMSYRVTRALLDVPSMGVVIMEMIPSERSGVMFTADPSDGDTSKIVIDAAFGQGEVVVSGEVEPDTYVLSKTGPALLHVRVGTKDFKLVRGPDGKDLHVDLDPDEASRRVLSDDEVIELARLGLRTEAHYGSPQDTEWAIADGQQYLVQSRPITTLGLASQAAQNESAPARPLVQGLAASAGRASGAVRILQSADQGDELIAGEVLVAKMTSPDWVPTMRRASALITDGGGITCHAAIVSRELGVPCVVGARNATMVLRTGEVVTVDGAEGTVYEGDLTAVAKTSVLVGEDHSSGAVVDGAATLPLATRLYVNLAFAEHAEEVAARDVDGVGLLRAEFMVT
ncbi:MAG: phosphoenolpyruvate synthase, partial [Acidobacteria bacterium]|nr:phosphoenolpyruvate synthase [Acidobacteriota bacterium]